MEGLRAGFDVLHTAVGPAGNGTSQPTAESTAEMILGQFDKDGDGKLTREEHAAAPEHADDKPASSGSSAAPSAASPSSGGSAGASESKAAK